MGVSFLKGRIRVRRQDYPGLLVGFSVESDPKTAGWREVVDLPEWGITEMVAKLDTGARSSCLDARGMDVDPDAPDRVRFWVDSPDGPVSRDEPILEWRLVRDSGGHSELRPVVAVRVRLGAAEWDDEVTLHDRSTMRHRMLIGRRVLAGRFRVDPAHAFLQTEPVQAPAAAATGAVVDDVASFN